MSFTFVALMLCCLASCSRVKIEKIDNAVVAGDLEIVKTLITDDPELVFSSAVKILIPIPLSVCGGTPLHYAANCGNRDMVELLLANKAEIDARDDFGETPLQLAAYKGQAMAAELLLASKADVNAQNNSGEAPLDLAAGEGAKEIVQMLLEKKAEVDARNMEGSTKLWIKRRQAATKSL